MSKVLIDDLARIALNAGAAILATKLNKTQYKEDFSPVTAADLAANKVICKALKALYPDIPIVSEENDNAVKSDPFFLIDPLDGTKEFISGNGEYCVLIAYIEGGRPIKSVIYAPELDDLYLANGEARFMKGFHFTSFDQGQILNVKKGSKIGFLSRSHPENELSKYYEKNEIKSFTVKGSALKFASLSKGEGDLYARFVSLSIWDIAAGDALVHAAGGVMTDHAGEKIIYRSDQLKSRPFIAKA